MNLKTEKLAIILGAALFCACKSSKIFEVPSSVRSFSGKTITAPPGMVYVPQGTIIEKRTGDDFVNSDTSSKVVSLSPFFIDETEVSNKQYRRFVDWVADSVAITTYLKNDPQYFYAQKSENGDEETQDTIDSLTRRINWSKVDLASKIPFWQSNSKKFPGLVKIVNGRKMLNEDMIKFTFSHIQIGGPDNYKLVTDTVKILPDNSVWTKDFQSSKSEFLVNSYFWVKGFDNYPVVGVTWKQARAYASWRTIISGALDKYSGSMGLVFSLPTEAQWQYAASGGSYHTDDNPGSIANENVNYAHGGTIKTVPVKSFAPNILGLYNMIGNVAEWTLDAYSPSAYELVEDHDPVLLLDVPDNDVEVMKRKVVIGGSWNDNAKSLNKVPRNYEIQNIAHSYIGFRCALEAPDLLSKYFETRTYSGPQKSKKNYVVTVTGK